MIEYLWKNKEGYSISTNHADINLEILHSFLSKESYWSKNIPMPLLKKALDHSMTFSLLDPKNNFIGFARLITDEATFAYLADVYVQKSYRGKKLGEWLIKTIMNISDLQIIRNWFLYTKDAHSLYEKFGWQSIDNPERAMTIRKSAEEIYSKMKI